MIAPDSRAANEDERPRRVLAGAGVAVILRDAGFHVLPASGVGYRFAG